MSIATKYRICQVMFGAGFAAVIYCITHMSPFASAHENIHWFILLSVSAAVGVGFGLGFYYFRAKLRENPMDKIQAEALANAGRLAKTTPPKK